MTLATLAGRISRLAIDNSPTILTTIGVVGAISTAYLTGVASFKAADIIRLKEGEDEEAGVIVPEPRELLKQRAELVWRLYIPPAIMGTAAVTCIIAANRIGSRRAAGLAAAATIFERSFEEYKEKVVEKIGEKKEVQIRDEIAQDRVNDTYLEDVRMRGLDKGEICYEMFGGQYFLSTVESLRGAVNSINAAIIHDGTATLGDFYRLLDIDVPAFSETIGWNSDRLLDISISATVIHETKPCLVISFKKDPLPDYGRGLGRFH